MNDEKLQSIFAADERIVEVRVYTARWVSKSYKWPAPATGTLYRRDGSQQEFKYDRKRPHGCGPQWVALSVRGGRLASA